MNQLFRLSSGILDVLDYEDVEYTFKQMKEMGIDNPPFQNFSIEVSKNFMLKYIKKKYGNNMLDKAKGFWSKNAQEAEEEEYNYSTFFEYKFQEDLKKYVMTCDRIYDDGVVVNMNYFVDVERSGNRITKEGLDEIERGIKFFSKTVLMFLIVLLATKNAEKNQIIDKDLARGRFNKRKAYRKDFPITTTITIGKITETHRSEHGGGTVRPHLRRGHIRTQKYGPKYELSKKIFIEPVFVNADEGWIAERRAYNVKAA